jgi:predicted  nucleic acid-binding Zn-ribbon protein
MKKIFTSICAILACEHLLSENGKITLDDAQFDALETAMAADKQTINDLNAQIATLQSEKQQLTTEKQTLSDANTQLQNEVNTLKQKPGDTTAHVVNDQHQQRTEKSEAEMYFESRANAQSLYDELP